MEKIIYKIINEIVKGVDTYTHNGSTWLIFSDTKQWVIELTKDNILWYNYNFFKNAFVYVSMDVVENQHYITKWVEDNIINGGGVKETSHNVMLFQSMMVEDTIQNGVKETKYNQSHQEPKFKDVLENGVKETIDLWMDDEEVVGYVIETGVKNTQLHKGVRPNATEDAIENGVKHTSPNLPKYEPPVNEIIQNGVKETHDDVYHHYGRIDGVMNNGVKETKEMDEWVNTPRIVGEVIENGVKETKTPNKDGDIVPFAEWMKENNSSSYTKMIDDVIDNGVKEVKADSSQNPMGQVDDVIENGIKETNSRNLEQFGIGYTLWKTQTVIEQGIKEVQPLPSQEGNRDWGIYYHKKGNRTKPHTEYVDEVINEGIKNK